MMGFNAMSFAAPAELPPFSDKNRRFYGKVILEVPLERYSSFFTALILSIYWFDIVCRRMA